MKGCWRKLFIVAEPGRTWRIVHRYYNSFWRHDGGEDRRKSFDRLYSPHYQVDKELASAAADLSELMLGAVSECCIRVLYPEG